MADCKPVTTPEFGSKLSARAIQPLTNITMFRSLAGVLQYLTITQLDIAFAVNSICQFVHKSTTLHLQAAKHIL